MMSKHVNDEMEFLRELVSDFISYPELCELSVETAFGTVSLRKYDNPHKIGFTPKVDDHE